MRRVSEYYTVTYRTVHTDLLTVDSARYCDRTYDILADLEWQTLGGGKMTFSNSAAYNDTR